MLTDKSKAKKAPYIRRGMCPENEISRSKQKYAANKVGNNRLR